MTTRLDALVVREYTDARGETKAAWTRIGTAFPSREGAGYTLVLDALPMPSLDRDGRLSCRVLLREPRQDDRPQQQHGQQRAQPQSQRRADAPAGYVDDDIPF